MKRFEEKVVVVIGAATGLGQAMSAQFAQEGANVVLADVNQALLDKAVERIRDNGGQALGVQANSMKRDTIEHLAKRVLAEHGRVDILCNNAGVNEFPSPAWEKTRGDLEWVMGVNFFGLVHAVETFLPIFFKQNSGHIVSTASNTSLNSIPGLAIYVASKKANLGYCEALQYDLQNAGSPVKVSVICPNKMATDMPAGARNRPADLPGRVATPEEIAMMHSYLEQDGHTPEQAAAIVLDGIAEGRFYILTMPVDAENVVRWAAAVGKGNIAPLALPQVQLEKH